MWHLALLALPPTAGPQTELVTSLPRYGKLRTPQWSGFLNASNAKTGTYLHYWFAAQNDKPCDDCPVVLWLNGGPGASSVLGMLQEQGPLLIGADGNLFDNPYAWTKVANLLVVESPAGVGYSYCVEMTQGGACANDDDSTAQALASGLQDFFQTKFPSLRGHRFFITGESYAGVYCPTVAAEILAANSRSGATPINLVGMAVGDPCTDNDSQRQSMDMLWYAHKYSLVPDDLYQYLTSTCGLTHRPSRVAGKWVSKKHGKITRVVASAESNSGLSSRLSSLSANCTAAMRRYLISSSKGVSQNWEHAYINELSFYSPRAEFRFDIPGTLNYHTSQFMMDPEVKRALHVESAPTKSWPGPAEGWSYTSKYSACNDNAKPGTKSMIEFYRMLAPQLSGPIVVYNGDTDPCVSYEGTRVAIEKVGFKVVQPYRPWFFNFSAASPEVLSKKDLLFGQTLALQGGGAQYGGEIVDYEHGLSFATVHGSGHMVPTFRPRAALKLIEHVIKGTKFAPPVPSDAELASMSDDDFDKFLDSWVDKAESADYILDPVS